MGQLDGRVAIVTGSGRGIGQCIALRLARDGARIVVNDLDEAPARDTIQRIESMGGEAVACNGDVCAPDFGKRIVATALERQANYSSGKAGIIGLTRTIAKEWGRYDVTVNAVAFGYILTRLTQPLQEGESGTIDVQGRRVKIGVQAGRISALNQMIPLGRGGLPEEAAGSVYLFCSPDSDYVSGQTLIVNGGA